jgi:tRNA-dihydrouridine synthase A
MKTLFKNNGICVDGLDRSLCVAPMMDWTDRHCRYFHRLLAPNALLFSEMVTAEAILHAGAEKFCRYHANEHPLALQLGGSDPARLEAAVRAVYTFGFDEINLNVGCPSSRVQSGQFGACLMAKPKLVADLVKAMRAQTNRPVTVKCRIGIDDMDAEAGLDRFVDTISDAGVRTIYLHARKAWLNGLSPKENREVPPLDYGRAERLARRRPDLDIILNGGLTDWNVTNAVLQKSGKIFAGVMLGRAAYKTPYELGLFHQRLFQKADPPDLYSVARQMTDYAEQQMKAGVSLHAVTRHMLGLCAGLRGARVFRRDLGELARAAETDWTLIETAITKCLRLNRTSNSKKVA